VSAPPALGPRLPPRRARWRAWLMLAIALGSAGFWVVVWSAGGLRVWELQSIDARFDIRGPRVAPEGIVVVAIDDRTLDELGERPPLRRSRYATAIDNLRAAGARLIVLDVQITEPTEPAEDNALIEALDRARPTVLAASEVDDDGNTNVLGGVEAQREFGVRVGSVNFPLDPGAVYRRLAYAPDGLRSLSVTAAEALGRRVAPFEQAWIDYAGPPGTVTTHSFVDALENRLPAGAVAGKTVVIGASALTMQDVHATSTSGDALMSGAEIQANALDTVLRGRPLREIPWPVGALAILAAAFVVPLAGLCLSPLRSEALGLLLGAGALAGAQAAFERGLIVPVIAPLGALATAAAGALVVHYLLVAIERERTRDLFTRFVPEQAARELLAGSDGRLLGGVRRDGTVLFADLREFSALAERIEPPEVIEVINRYLGETSEAVLAAGGTLVSFLGDGVMAVFGAPLEQPDHADRALAAAREILDVRMPRFNAWLGERGLGGPLRIGIGIGSGEVMSGHVGSERRVEYAAVGDTTNIAARLEALTSEHGVQLLLSDATRARLREVPSDLVPVGALAVRGRQGRVEAWTLQGS
jgi:adenylate cyclase